MLMMVGLKTDDPFYSLEIVLILWMFETLELKKV